ncbi:MAG: hypothetical protein HY805_06290 [Nitrospirae bacterium]|nr:hypothetical protein [Nitrospirota bacterium]
MKKLSAYVLIISMPAGGDQISSTYDEKGHGLFTYFMLRGLKGKGNADGDGRLIER